MAAFGVLWRVLLNGFFHLDLLIDRYTFRLRHLLSSLLTKFDNDDCEDDQDAASDTCAYNYTENLSAPAYFLPIGSYRLQNIGSQ